MDKFIVKRPQLNLNDSEQTVSNSDDTTAAQLLLNPVRLVIRLAQMPPLTITLMLSLQLQNPPHNSHVNLASRKSQRLPNIPGLREQAKVICAKFAASMVFRSLLVLGLQNRFL
jgi:hypothetical protein